MLAEPANAPFNNPEWIYEPKWDGIRATAYVHGEQVRLFSRNLQNFTGLFASIAESLKAVGVPIVLDGEVVALGAEGRPDFATLQHWLRPGKQPRTGHVTYIVFDCLYVNGHNRKPGFRFGYAPGSPGIRRMSLLGRFARGGWR